MSGPVLTLATAAIDGGVRLALAGEGGGVELRLGWKAAMRLARHISTAMTLDPPMVLSDGGDWADQMFEVGEQGVRVAEGGGCEPLNQVFVRVIGAGLDLAAVLDAPAAVFASDDEGHNRFFAPDAAVDLGDRGRVAVEGAVEPSHGGQDGPAGGEPKILIAAAAVVGEHDLEPIVGGDAGPAEGDDGEPGVGPAAGGAPLQPDLNAAESRQQDLNHSELSFRGLQPGEEAESGAAGTPSPAEPVSAAEAVR
jgi:hypothetical protein